MNYEITDFQKDVLERSRQIPVLVDFWAEWCAPCRVLGPVLEKLALQADETWALAKVDTERFTAVAETYQIRSIPNVKLFVDGTVIAEFAGALPEHMVKEWINKHVPSKFEKVMKMVEQMLAESKGQEARELVKEIVTQEPDNHKARVLLAKTYLPDDPDKTIEALQPIEEDSEEFGNADGVRTFADLFKKEVSPQSLPDSDAKQTYLSAVHALRENDFERALERFIAVIRSDRYFDDDGARKACIAIFKTLGEEHELTQKHRREFSSALYCNCGLRNLVKVRSA